MKISLFLIFIGIFLVGCKSATVFNEELPKKEGVIIEIPTIANLSLDELDKKLGSPESKQKVEEIIRSRTYSLNKGEADLIVRLRKDKSISEMTLRLKNRRDTAEQVLKAGGFEMSEPKPDWENAIVKKYENRTFKGIYFEEISAGMHPPTEKWDELRIIVKR